MIAKHCRYLQYQVSRQQAIRTPSRTVIIQTLNKDAVKVSSTDLNSQLPLDPFQPHQPRLCSPPHAWTRKPEEKKHTVRLWICLFITYKELYGVLLQSYLKELWGLVAGVVCLDGGVMVPSSCSLSVSTVEWLSGVVAPLSWGVGWLLMDSMRELRTTWKGPKSF